MPNFGNPSHTESVTISKCLIIMSVGIVCACISHCVGDVGSLGSNTIYSFLSPLPHFEQTVKVQPTASCLGLVKRSVSNGDWRERGGDCHRGGRVTEAIRGEERRKTTQITLNRVLLLHFIQHLPSYVQAS